MSNNDIPRRAFLQGGAALPLAMSLNSPWHGADVDSTAPEESLAELQRMVKMSGDGPSMAPREYAHLLSTILDQEEIQPDYYSNGGVVEALEEKMADILGKERAVFLPTGTLANHLALRIQTGGRSRAIVQKESHVYNDSGDCAQLLSNLNLVPLAPTGGTFTLEEVQASMGRAERGRVKTGVGVISIESPIRRLLGKLFDFEEMKRICSFARDQGIATHMDGARLFMASGYTGINPREYASHFDTVYVSMWKYLNAPSGAILAGPSNLLDSLFHDRRMFGGGLPYAWPFAAAALHSIDGFQERFQTGVEAGKELKPALNALPGLRVEEIPNGSNVYKLHLEEGDPERLRRSLREEGIILPSPHPYFRGFALAVNETLARRPLDQIVRSFREALSQG